MAVVDIKTKDEFDSLVQSTPYVALQAHATWCGPCKAIAPVFSRHAASQSVPQKYTFARFDTDEVPDLAYELNIRSIPAFYFFEKGGRAADLDVAGTSPPALKKSIDECYAKAQAKPNANRNSVCYPIQSEDATCLLSAQSILNNRGFLRMQTLLEQCSQH